MLPAPSPRRWRALAALAALAALLPTLAACDGGGPDPTTDDVVAGVNFTRLFAPPTPAEVAAVEATWAARGTPAATDAAVVAEARDGDATVYVVAHTMATGPGAPLTHYGLVRVPDGAAGWPVLVVHHGGDDGVAVGAPGGAGETSNGSLRAMARDFPDLFASTVQVLPTYRAETLHTDGLAALGGPYTSGGTPSPWDYDVDDAMGLLSAVLALPAFDAAADAGRVAALGFSRGGGVALLQAARDARVDAVADFYGPTDFFGTSLRPLAVGLLGGLPSALSYPGALYLLEEVLRPLQGPGADYAAARLEVLRRSPAYFTARLPHTLALHHHGDAVVPVAQTITLRERLAAAPPTGDARVELYGTAGMPTAGRYHDPAEMPDGRALAQSFVLDRVGAAPLAPALLAD